ncbi:MAG: nicotinate-nicotinamide nucleotide adenylyltransferase [Neptuniibacter caesariensis]|uniref:Probable nicotinate-nucleotide adenylyltransferase n=1 Tax=Neptuniibacter caesariensis TaxID=207954 RepID=A0A2G6JE44_NEPCE|nr:MAG: nicotinate-nicotinamide nucleotide adenylyltransferase [Neptuniibacter caesariensis]
MAPDAFIFMGGTFDPVHNGHLRTALEIKTWAGVSQVCMLPAGDPVHRRAPGRSPEQRLAMVSLAVADEPALIVDDCEVLSDQPSYSLLTLQSLRQAMGPERSIVMVMGMDAYQTLPSWHEWRRFTDYAHLLVVKRPGYALPNDPQLDQFTEQHIAQDLDEVMNTPAGHVIFHELTPLGISATQIRDVIKRGESPRYLLPDQVWNYIQKHRLYGLDEERAGTTSPTN